MTTSVILASVGLPTPDRTMASELHKTVRATSLLAIVRSRDDLPKEGPCQVALGKAGGELPEMPADDLSVRVSLENARECRRAVREGALRVRRGRPLLRGHLGEIRTPPP